MAAFRYPLDMDRGSTVNFKSRKSPDGTKVNFECDLYAPVAFTLADGASYGNFDLGIIGSSGVVDQFMDKKGEKFDAKTITSQFGGEGAQNKYMALSAGSAVGMGGGVVDKIKDIYGAQKGIAVNPNSVLQFTGNEIRGYNFEFRMVARSQAESDQIRFITEFFRYYMYPEKNGFLLQYPDVWEITFNNENGSDLYLPNIADCYLTNMSTIYNSTGNMLHADGAPTDVTVQLQFREGRALARSDVIALATGNRVKISVE